MISPQELHSLKLPKAIEVPPPVEERHPGNHSDVRVIQTPNHIIVIPRFPTLVDDVQIQS